MLKPEYGEDSIKVLHAPDAVRRKPEMWIGGYEPKAVANHLAIEALCVALDDALDGKVQDASIRADGPYRFIVEDDGPGWRIDLRADGSSHAESMFTELNACSIAKRHANARTHCEAGMLAVNALADSLLFETVRDGILWKMSFARGVCLQHATNTGSTTRRGTRIDVTLDTEFIRHPLNLDDLILLVARIASPIKVTVHRS